ncbi:hypothetical protein GO003_025270 [Methylicorpusculum oleiharenae]|uniref:DUF6686 family protein n=1 Tax=Methylicorpusculum oleiharenae TaxID=1338687 RepID=UPI0013585E3A|nr:DUF6686 family protein [Methylicorpusculum oleiharenae]MCD2453694.1 hypothetical protein [Methylicorpusculum oleiharenae]
MSKKPCTHEYLASNQAGKILTCRECGVVHLHWQNLSLRLDVEQFEDLALLIAQASKNLSRQNQKTVRTRPMLSMVT